MYRTARLPRDLCNESRQKKDLYGEIPPIQSSRPALSGKNYGYSILYLECQ